MKKYFFLYLLIGCMIGMTACSDDDKYTDTVIELQAEKTTMEITAAGGTGTIVMNMDGIEATAADSWCVPTVNGKTVTLVIASNPTYESRTTVVTVKRGNESQSFPVTQLGIVSNVEIASHDFTYLGGTLKFLCKSTEQVQFTGLPSWMTYTIANDTLTFSVPEMTATERTRSADVTMEVGLFKKTVTFRQIEALLPYDLLLGEWQMTYAKADGEALDTIAVEMEQNERYKSFNMKSSSLPAPIFVEYFNTTEEAGINIAAQDLGTYEDNGSTFTVRLCSWMGGAGNPKVWSFWFSVTIGGIKSNWNGVRENLVFPMINRNPVTSNNTTLYPASFIVWTFNSAGASAGEYRGHANTRFVNITLTKKP